MAEDMHTLMVYPASSRLGYEVCRELVGGVDNKKDNDGDHQAHEILAVCLSPEETDKLKDLGKNVRVIILEQASRLECWRQQLEFERIDGVILLSDPSAVPASHTGRGRGGNLGMELVKSLEVCVEMASHMRAEALVYVTAFAAEDPSFRTFHRMYQVVNDSAFKFNFVDRAMLFCNFVYEALELNRSEIQQYHRLSWPVAADTVSCPIAVTDISKSCVSAMTQLLEGGRGDGGGGHAKPQPPGHEKPQPPKPQPPKDEEPKPPKDGDGDGGGGDDDNDGDHKKKKKKKKKKQSTYPGNVDDDDHEDDDDVGDDDDSDNEFSAVRRRKGRKGGPPGRDKDVRRSGKFYLTGQDRVTPRDMIDGLSSELKQAIEFKQINKQAWKRVVGRDESNFEMICFLEVFDMLSQGKLAISTNDIEVLTGSKATNFDDWLKNRRNDFRGKNSKM